MKTNYTANAAIHARTTQIRTWSLSAAKGIVSNAYGFFFPPLCLLCDKPLSDSDSWLCNKCLDKLDTNAKQRNACPRCSQNRSRHRCACDLVWDYPFSRLFSMFDFDDTIKKIAHNFKYKGRKALAFHIGKRYAYLIPNDFFDSIHCVTTIPLHFFRFIKRGYNQAEFLAKGIIEGIKRDIVFIPGAVRRTRHTKTQTKLDKQQREKNLADAFAVASSKAMFIRGKNVVLVDDVVTTGATTSHCAKALLKAGAHEVRVLSLARD